MMTKTQYDAHFDDMKKAGYRLADREIYVHKGVWTFSAAWVENAPTHRHAAATRVTTPTPKNHPTR